MNIHGIEKDSMLNGEGLRVVLWVSGCNHRCPGCHNPQTWDQNSGEEFTEEKKKELIENLKPDWISGLTLSGGDPIFPAIKEEVTKLAKEIKELFPDKTIWLYTGSEMDKIQDEPILQYVDVVVDGEFQKDREDVNYPHAGSTNQKVYRKKKDGLGNDIWVDSSELF